MKFQRLHISRRKSLIIIATLSLLTMIVTLTSQTYCDAPTRAVAATGCSLSGGQHTYSEWITLQKQTCTRAQIDIRSCKCVYGMMRRTDALGHQVTGMDIKQNPTCDKPGYAESTCTRCGHVWHTNLDITGHTWSDWYIVQELSCTQDEVHERTCDGCSKSETTVTSATTGHNWTEWAVKQPQSCTQDEVKIRSCNTCHTTEQNVTPAPGHKYSKFTQLRAPTCCTLGQKQRVCQVCAHTSTKEIDTIPHTYQNGQCTACNADDPAYWPKTYKDNGVSITITKVDGYGKGNTTCYIADVQLTNYTRFFTACGKNKYGGQSTTSSAAQLQKAVLTINGCYSAPYLNYSVVRRGVICNGANNTAWSPAVYSSHTGLFQSSDDAKQLSTAGNTIQSLVDQGIVTDTFCFGPPVLIDGTVTVDESNDRAQRTFIGTNGTPGHLLLCVSNGRYSDKKSAGLTYQEMGQLMKEYGCTFGIPLDGGGSSTMVFKGTVLNQLKNGQERDWIVDFCCIGY